MKELLPNVLKKDDRVKAFAELEKSSFEAITEKLPYIFIYNLKNLSDEELETLAWQFDITSTEWDLATTREQKEELIKNNILLKAKKGTKWAIERVLELLGLEGKVQEWFEYGGEPYKFKVEINLKYKGLQLNTYDKLLNLIEEYKNLRSQLDVLNVYATSQFAQHRAIATLSGYDTKVYPYQVKEINLQTKQFRTFIYQSACTTIVYPQA